MISSWPSSLLSHVFCPWGSKPFRVSPFHQEWRKTCTAVYSVSSWVASMQVDLDYQLGLSAPRKLVIIHLVVSGDNWHEWEMGKTCFECGQPKCRRNQMESLLDNSWTTLVLFSSLYYHHCQWTSDSRFFSFGMWTCTTDSPGHCQATSSRLEMDPLFFLFWSFQLLALNSHSLLWISSSSVDCQPLIVQANVIDFLL